jgi:hypothetical protein
MLVVVALALFAGALCASAATDNMTVSIPSPSNGTGPLSRIVKSNSELIDALAANSAGTIFMAADIKLDPVAWMPYIGHPIGMTRNVTLIGVSNGSRPPVLDTNWLFPTLLLSEGYTFTIRNLIMAGADTNIAMTLFTSE